MNRGRRGHLCAQGVLKGLGKRVCFGPHCEERAGQCLELGVEHPSAAGARGTSEKEEKEELAMGKGWNSELRTSH